MRIHLLYFILFVLHLLPLNSNSQQYTANNTNLSFEQPYTLQHADINSVNCIFKDSRHMMWFGTKNGLYRYDGINLRYFEHKTGDSTSLPNNTVLGTAEDKDGKLWVALISGIAEIDLATLHCKTFGVNDQKLNINNFTNRICIDDTGNIWIGNNLGIFIFDKKKELFSQVWNNKAAGDSMSKYITSLISAGKHLLIGSTFHDLIFFNKDDHSFKRIPLFTAVPPKDTSITAIFPDSKQTLWIGTWGGGIYCYNLAKKKLSHCNLQAAVHLPFFYVTSFYETTFNKERFIWTSTIAGLVKCSVDTAGSITGFDFINYNKNAKNSILPDKLESVYFDDDGALWCAGDAGVCKCFPFQNNFKFFTVLQGSIMDIQPVEINNDAYFFISSWNAPEGPGFLLTDMQGNEVHKNLDLHFADKEEDKNLSGIVKDKYNRLWISSTAGVCVLNTKLEVIKQWNKNTEGENKLTYCRTSGITIHNDTVWVTCYHHGIDLFDLSFKKLRHYTGTENRGLEDNVLSSFFNDSKGNLWICGNKYLYKYLSGTGTFKSYKLSPEPGGCGPKEISETKNGNFIIASYKGILQFDPVTEKYSYIQTDILQKEQSVSSAAIDKNGEIWFLTDKHLVHYKPGEKRFILFGKEDGLDISKGMYELRTFNGTNFYICQEGQVIQFNCDSWHQPAVPPYLVLSMQLNDSTIYLQDSNTVLYFPHDKNKLQFEFAGVSYIKADQNQYYYRLSDVDKQWNITYKNAVSYAGLPAGSYTFKVKTVNYAGMWSGEKAMHFIINPPYWRTWWFIIAAAIGMFSILYFIIRYVSQRNLKEKILQLEKETAVEKERNRIAQDMHDDLGSELTQIAIQSEIVKRKINQQEEAIVQLDNISNSSRTLIDNLQDIIWMLNTKHDQLESIALYIREYATKYFEQSGINVSFKYPAQIAAIKIGEENRRSFFMAIKEAFNNIVKHADAENVKIELAIEQRTVNLIVSDDGKGFNTEETRKFANGVKNMQSRMLQAGGSCKIISGFGNGTTIIFTYFL